MSLLSKILMDADTMDEKCGKSAVLLSLQQINKSEPENLNKLNIYKSYEKILHLKSKKYKIINKLNLNSSRIIYNQLLDDMEKTLDKLVFKETELWYEEILEKYNKSLHITIN